MKKLLGIFLSCLLLTGCGGSEQVKSDMSHYEGFTDTNHVFYDMEVKDIKQAIDQKETVVVYFGFSSCPWCVEALPILNDVAKEYSQSIGYIDTRKDASWQSNLDITDYDVVVEYLGDYLEYDDNGIKHLYTPMLFFIKDGEVVASHQGTVEDHDAHERQMTEEEQEQLKETYQNAFALLQ